MLKRDTLDKASARALSDSFKCGECLHFRQHSHTDKQKLCKDLGVKAFAVAPKCFTPDVTKIAKNTDVLAQVAVIMGSFSRQEQRILCGLLRSKKKKEFHFGTKLYFRAFGKDYVSNYLSGYVAGYTSSGQLILMGSPDVKSRGRSYTMYCESTDHLLTLSQWKQKKRELIASGKKIDPKPLFDKRTKLTDNDEPPTIDSAPKEWKEKTSKGKKKSKSSNVFKIS